MRLLFLFFCFYNNLIFSQDYYVYVAAESDDQVSLIKFDGEKAIELKKLNVGVWPAENEGPHGITVDPYGKYWYLTLAHGNPYGTLYKFSTETNEVVGETKLGIVFNTDESDQPGKHWISMYIDLEGKNFFCADNKKAEVGEDGFITLTFENFL